MASHEPTDWMKLADRVIPMKVMPGASDSTQRRAALPPPKEARRRPVFRLDQAPVVDNMLCLFAGAGSIDPLKHWKPSSVSNSYRKADGESGADEVIRG